MNEKNPLIRLLLAVTAIFALAAGCASAPATAPAASDASAESAGVAAAPTEEQTQADPNGQTCRMVRPTGSRIGERVCKPNSEWARLESESQEAIDRMQKDQQAAGGDGGG